MEDAVKERATTMLSIPKNNGDQETSQLFLLDSWVKATGKCPFDETMKGIGTSGENSILLIQERKQSISWQIGVMHKRVQ